MESLKAHEKIYDIMLGNQDYWYSVAQMRDSSGLSESTVRRAFKHLEAAQMIEGRFLGGRTQYTMAFIASPIVDPKSRRRGWFRRKTK